jgi:hypothetical protein
MSEFVISGVERIELKKELHLLRDFIKYYWNNLYETNSMNEENAQSKYDEAKIEIAVIERKLKKKC